MSIISIFIDIFIKLLRWNTAVRHIGQGLCLYPDRLHFGQVDLAEFLEVVVDVPGEDGDGLGVFDAAIKFRRISLDSICIY